MPTNGTALQTRLRCFVAMAFGNADTDAVYAAVKRSLDKIGVTTRRVDRIEHNDDIDDRIIAEIKEADLVIADLTYARPSVYFEAGYAQRAIPVIYIARNDHFLSRADDPHGNFQVHFDLKMRNIIAWSSAKDDAFLKRLTARVLKVIAPVVRQKNETLHHDKQIAAFDRLSLRDKHTGLFQTASDHFRKLGYIVVDLSHSEQERPILIHVSSQLRYGTFVAIRHTRSRFHCVFFHVTASITAKLCKAYKFSLIRLPLYSPMVDFLPPKTVPKYLREDIIICSFGSGGLKRIRNEILYLRLGDTDQTLSFETDIGIFRHGKDINLQRRITVHVFESSGRLMRLQEILNERFTRG
jgi:nucleoside 2-deoxyribosyltransferase